MTTTLENQQLSFGITGRVTAAVGIESHSEKPPEPVPPAAAQLKEGWYNTEKYGYVFISPGGVCWVVQRIGEKLESVAVKITKDDIIQKPSAERVKNARRLAVWRNKSRVSVTKQPILTAGAVSVANGEVLT
jgi:hypothetical protein